MPILPKEDYLYPLDLFDTDKFIVDGEKWFVLHTFPRAEKTVARELQRHRVTHFLPVYKRREKTRTRWVTSWLPLFPGYVFLRANEEGRAVAFQTNKLANCIEVREPERLIEDLCQVWGLIETEAPLSPEDRIEVGQTAEVITGPLEGRRGLVVEEAGRTKLIIVVEMLSRGVSVEVDRATLRPI